MTAEKEERAGKGITAHKPPPGLGSGPLADLEAADAAKTARVRMTTGDAGMAIAV